jgi:hypothetical protein
VPSDPELNIARSPESALNVARSTAPQKAGNQGMAALATGPSLRRLLGKAGLGVVLVLCLLVLVQQVLQVSRGTTDFCQDYLAAQRMMHGVPVYLPLHCWRGVLPVPAPLEYDSHPPAAEVLFWPFGLLSPILASTIWGGCCLAAYVLAGYLLMRALAWPLLRSMTLFVLFSLFWQPFTLAESVQNFPQLLMFLLALAWVLERQQRQQWAGICLGIASLLKIWPVALFLVPLVRRQRRFVLAGGATVLGGILLSLAFLGPSAYAAYLGPVRENETYYVPDPGNISLVGAIVRPLTGYHAAPVNVPGLVEGVSLSQAVLLGELAAGLLLLAVLGLLVWRARYRHAETVALLSLCLLITTMQLVFPFTLYSGLPVLLLPAALLMLALRGLPRPPRWWFCLMAVGVLPLLAPGWVLVLPAWLITQHGPGLVGLGVALYGLPTGGLLLLVGGLGWLFWQATSERADQPLVRSGGQGEGAGTA